MSIDDGVMSQCLNCGYLAGAFLPGIPCPECGEPML